MFNASKCYLMHIHRGILTKSYFYQMCGEFPSPVTNGKYLGIHITQGLSWSLHIDRMVTKALQKLEFIRRNLRGAPAQCKQLAYIALVRPRVEYASTIWDPHINVYSNKLAVLAPHQCYIPDEPAEIATPVRPKACPMPNLPVQNPTS